MTRETSGRRVVLITGAARGQGLATAKLFAQEGAALALTDISPTVSAAAESVGGEAIGLVHDVTDESSWQSVVEEVSRRLGPVTVLINNAGIFYNSSLMKGAADLEAMYRVNELGPFLGIRAVAPMMAAAGGGAIVNVSSTAGLKGVAGSIPYSMTKWAVRGLTRGAALELAPTGIRVNCILPGLIETDMATMNSADAIASVVAGTPLGRMGTAEEVARLSVMLASDASGFITGAEFVIDGGRTA